MIRVFIDNGLKLNTSKCIKMSYTRSRNKINYDYHILDDKLVEINTIQDLGVIFQSNLSFLSHIEKSCTKTLKSLGFLIRCTKEFNDEHCLKTLYVSLVRPLLEYCSVLWNPTQFGHIESLDRIQTHFLRLICYKRRLILDPSLPCSSSTLSFI
jgi:hypothetical protein